MSQPREFDVCGPLPSGVTVLEASAGTGKTYTIAALAARYVAEGIPLERMLLVTFTRMATGELRERVRDRLIEVERGLAARLAGASSAGDPIVDLLFVGNAEVARRRLAHAVAGFDAATIATTHGFCQEVLGGLGIAGDLEPDVTFVEDLSDLAADVVDDLYVRKFRRGEAPAFNLSQASEIARAAIENPSAALVSASGPVPEMRTGLARAARQELERRKRAAAVMTYDDLVTRLQPGVSIDAVHHGQFEDAARAARPRTDHVSRLDPSAARCIRQHLAEAPEDVRKRRARVLDAVDACGHLEVIALVASRVLELIRRDQHGADRCRKVLALHRAHAQLHLPSLDVTSTPVVHHAIAGNVALRLLGIEVCATHADHRRNLELVVHLRTTRRNRDVNVRAADGVGIAEVEDGQLIPVRVHLEAASLARRAHVLLERIEIANRRRRWDRRLDLHGVELEHVSRIPAEGLALGREPRPIITEQAEQGGARRGRVDTSVDQEAGALGRVLRVGERHPAH